MLDQTYVKRQSVKGQAAVDRQQFAATLSPLDRLAKLDRKLGKGVGAVKERARLMAKLTEAQKATYEAK